jgi:hypothetical protein
MYNLCNGKVLVSRGVEFDKVISWNWEAKKETNYSFLLYFEGHDQEI